MKGMYTQCVVVLAESPVSIGELQPLLPEFPIVRTVETDSEWYFSGSTAVVEYRPDVNGMVAIDVVDRTWPDDMGNPRTEAMLFGAWGMGYFGPYAYPNGLDRAVKHAWGWPEAKAIIPRHCGFLRIRTSYLFGAEPETKVLPEEYRPQQELEFIVEIAQGILDHPAALAYFNPNGEVLATKKMVNDSVTFGREHDLPALDLWSNVRMFALNPEWMLMDTVGCWQLDMPDHEATFPKNRFQPNDVANFLRNASAYVLKGDRPIKDYDTMNGPGGIAWQAIRFADPIAVPPREVYCWVPTGTKGIPQQVTKRKRARE